MVKQPQSFNKRFLTLRMLMTLQTMPSLPLLRQTMPQTMPSLPLLPQTMPQTMP
jgi:hypothetical protein